MKARAPDRVAAAAQSLFRLDADPPSEQTGIRLYRTLDWGSVARIILLDTRLIGRISRVINARSACTCFPNSAGMYNSGGRVDVRNY